MAPPALIAAVLAAGSFAAFHAVAHDRIASIGDSGPSSEAATAPTQRLVELVRALDRATHSSTKVVLRPFARSLEETAAGLADFHIPLMQSDASPAPEGLVYVMDVDFGQVQFVIYSRKLAPLDASSVTTAKNVETEPGHETFFPFPVSATHCLPCSLDKILLGRTDALIAASGVVDPLLPAPKYKGIHRALFKSFPVRALVPAKANSSATRRYLIDGVKRLKETGELSAIMRQEAAYSDWQP
jgi:hypothetical protein